MIALTSSVRPCHQYSYNNIFEKEKKSKIKTYHTIAAVLRPSRLWNEAEDGRRRATDKVRTAAKIRPAIAADV